MSKVGVEVGDKVTVQFLNNDTIEGVVRYMPQDTGDAWIIECENTVVHVQNYAAIWKVKARKGTR